MIGALLLLLVAQPTPTVTGIGAFEATLYRPGIDGGLGGTTPYSDVFGSSRGALYGGRAGLELGFGRDLGLTLQLHVAHFGASAKAFVDDGSATTPSSGKARSAGETSLAVTPVSFGLGLRYTGLWRRLALPVVPYVEAGPALALWSVGKGDGGTAAEGYTTGLFGSAGLSFPLTSLDPKGASSLKEEFSISSIALNVGVLRLWLDGFGAKDQLPLSDTAWTAGLELGF